MILLGLTSTVLSAGPAAAVVNAVKLVVISDGSAPFDSRDAGATNGKVRTNDVVTYGWSYTSDTAAASSTMTFVQTLSAPPSVVFDPSNLAQCTAAAGSISADGQTLTCPVTINPSGSGLVPITVSTPAGLANGTTFTSTLSGNNGALTGGSQSLEVVRYRSTTCGPTCSARPPWPARVGSRAGATPTASWSPPPPAAGASRLSPAP